MKYMTFKVMILLFVLFGFRDCFSVTIAQFLDGAAQESALQGKNDRLEIMKNKAGTVPFLERLELRSSTEEYELTRHSLRFSFKGWGETDAGEKFLDAEITVNEADKEMTLSQILQRRYHLIINYFYLKNHLRLKNDLTLLYEDRINVLQQSVNSLDFDIRDLIEAQDEISKVKLDQIALKKGLEFCRSDIIRMADSAGLLQFNERDVIGIDLLSSKIDYFSKINEDANPILFTQKAKVEKEKCRMDLETAENRKYISFFEVSYDDNDRIDEDKAPFSFEVGLRIPLVNSGHADMQRRKIKYLSEKDEFQTIKSELDEHVRKLSFELKVLTEQYFCLTAAKQNGDAESTYTTLLSMEGIDPLSLLTVKEGMLKSDIAKEEKKYEIYCKYLELLTVSGTLTQKPLLNYLSSGMEKL